ncbi:pyridoxamine 5'-phosphate oxidase [Cyclobacterium jeungdonense]|uniref:Pyridoxine/pyridoxamine 5'-phosphate oxidase n=1 Tax=Cyclobacterium jeungdonense TaxID=708087 RepID=A0ABT8C7F5_9BACT|nr:pyridoxamine 5'-phosphate oxidase [Cyclobacterium jeungdonense]MDN3688445.1 pyridoxamine 5'-phosphate oxidase [Cyclobacterium jeungdonense]
MKLADIRKEYSSKTLDIKGMFTSPLAQFELWLSEALSAQVNEPTAMHLCTVDAEMRPAGRIVLLKGVDKGFVFFTNYGSKKSQQLSHQPYASLTFFWPELERQVRVSGRVARISAAESDEYYLSRPQESQIGAWVSPQSQVIPDREFLEKKLVEVVSKFQKEPLKRPEHWGGFRLEPESMEFWQGRPARLHDRILYTLPSSDSRWKMERLAP